MALKIIGDIVAFIFGLIFAFQFFMYLKLFIFTVPHTNKMISNGIIEEKMKSQIILVDAFSATLLVIISVALIVLLYNWIGMIVIYVALTGLIVGSVINAKQSYRFIYNRRNVEQYANRHSVCMDMERYQKWYQNYIDSLEK